MHFLDYWTKTRIRLDNEIIRRIPRLFSALGPQQAETVRRIIKDGKHIRGCLVCLVNHALGGKLEAALPRAVAIECIQAASLIHDDYVDNDMIRRRRPATWTVEGPQRAVLLGDVIFATAIEAMAKLSKEDGATVARAIATVANGAYQELFWLEKPAASRNASGDAGTIYERIIYLKTGALFGAACQLGAIATGASQEIRTLAYAFGARTGEAYQIADDLNDFVALGEHPQEYLKKLPPLLPALNYYCHKAGQSIPTHLMGQKKVLHDWYRRIEKDFTSHMEQEINRRLKLTESCLGLFPDTLYYQILSQAPARIVAMMPHTATPEVLIPA